MKKKGNNLEITAYCPTCQFADIKSGDEYICRNPQMKLADVAEAVVDTFFGGSCKRYISTMPHKPQNSP